MTEIKTLEFGGDPGPHGRVIRLPTRGQGPLTGLTWTWFNAATEAGEIPSACVRQRGKLPGSRRVDPPRVLKFIAEPGAAPANFAGAADGKSTVAKEAAVRGAVTP